jgi:transposase
MLNTTDKIIKHKTGLLNLAEELGNVSKACQVMGMSRDTFYRYKSAVEDGGVEALFERTRRKPNLANRVDQATEDTVIKNATDFPAYGQARTSNELRKLGVFVSPSGVRSIWLRHDLANFKTRLKALEAKVAEEGGVLTEAQVLLAQSQIIRPQTQIISTSFCNRELFMFLMVKISPPPKLSTKSEPF